jgi:phosphoribosylpyrophosphate synthetase
MIAQQYGYEMVSGHKQRSTYNEVDTITISSQDQAKIVNKVCYIIDDMYDTG